MNLSFDEFYNLTPRQFSNKLIGYRRKEEEGIKLQYILNYDLQRLFIVGSFLEKKDKEQLLKGLEKFPWETENEQPDKERKFKTKAEIDAIWDKLDNK